MNKVTLSTGEILNFPDTMTKEEMAPHIQSFASQNQPEKAQGLEASQDAAPFSARAKDVGAAVGKGALQGATFGFSDEMAGAIGALYAKGYDKLTGKNLFEDKSLKDLYKESRGEVREDIAETREKAPGAFLAGEIAGSLTPGTAILKGAKGIKGLAKAGVATGAVAGAGYSEAETVPELAKDIGIGGAFGGATGGALGAVGKGVRATKNAAQKIFRGADPQDIIASRLDVEKVPSMIKQIKDATAKGEPLLLPDIGGDEIVGLSRAVGRTSGGARNIVENALRDRQGKEAARLTKLLSKDVSNVDAYFTNLNDLATARSKMAAPIYKEAFSQGGSIKLSPKLLKDERIQTALKRGKTEYGVEPDVALDSLEALDGAKKAIDDIISSSLRKGNNMKARAYLKLKGNMVKELDEKVPAYAKARKVFSDFASLSNAQEEGLKFNKLSGEQLKIYMKSLAPSEKEAFRIGVRENLQNAIYKTADSGSGAKKIFGNIMKREQLKQIFEDELNFKDFSRRLEQEIKAADSSFKILGGSRTDINLADDGRVIQKAITEGAQALREGQLGIVRKITEGVVSIIEARYNGLTNANAKKIAKTLMNPEESVKTLESILTKIPNTTQRSIARQIFEDYAAKATVVQQTRKMVEAPNDR